jgi:excisionase family DNA binding protein
MTADVLSSEGGHLLRAVVILRRVERITTAQAARRLGVSQTQVRRLVASGRLRAETVERPQGSRLFVLWEPAEEAPQDTPGTPQPTQQDAPKVATEDATLRASDAPSVAWLKARLEQAETERAELRRMLNLEQQTVAALRADLAAAHATARAIDAPGTHQRTPPRWPLDATPTPHAAEPAAASEKRPESVEPTQMTPTAPPRPWWRRWR